MEMSFPREQGGAAGFRPVFFTHNLAHEVAVLMVLPLRTPPHPDGFICKRSTHIVNICFQKLAHVIETTAHNIH